MKPGQVVEPKTRSAADPSVPGRRQVALANASRPFAGGRRIAVALVLLAWWLAPIACSGEFITPAQLTATAVSGTAVSAASASTTVASTTVASTAVAANQITVTPTVDPELSPTSQGSSGDPLPVAPTAGPTATATRPPAASPTTDTTQDPPILYYTQAGDTLKAVAARFNVAQADITSPEKIAHEGLFNPGVLLLIPRRLGEVSSSTPLIPDSEVVYSPSALDFDIEQFVNEAGGYLKTYKEWRSIGWLDGPKAIHRVGIENSINPRLLLVILERQSHWVYGQPKSLAETDYPIGWLKTENDKKGLYFQLSWAVQQLNIGYYGWRDGTVTELTFPDGKKLRLAPDLNAGTVALQYLFSRLYTQPQWAGVLYGPDGLMTQYENMFGSPWLRAQTVEPLFPATLTQPPLELPFLSGHTWSFTGGPHSAWGEATSMLAALDLAPSASEHGCYTSNEWVVASAPGLIVRSENGVVMLDLDGDGYEQTGWDVMYLHIATQDRVPVGAWVNLDDHIGHPSCEGGEATGTHTHIARKYNGEWILADGPMPFNLSGWVAHAGKAPYQGTLINGTKLVISSQVGSFESRITRP